MRPTRRPQVHTEVHRVGSFRSESDPGCRVKTRVFHGKKACSKALGMLEGAVLSQKAMFQVL